MSKQIVPQPEVPSDPDCLDLSALLAPISRDDVELLLVRLLDKHPDEANWIVQVRERISCSFTQVCTQSMNFRTLLQITHAHTLFVLS